MMKDGLDVPEVVPWKSGVGRSGSPVDTPQVWSSEEIMRPELSHPLAVKYREITRGAVMAALLVYLACWSFAAAWLLGGTKVATQDLLMLLNIFVTPLLPIIGVAVGYYFNHKLSRSR